MPPQVQSDLTRRAFLAAAGQGIVVASAAAAGVSATQQGVPLAPPDKQPPNLKIPAPPTKKIGFAIVGLGELAIQQVLPAFALTEHCRPTALVSGHPEKAEDLAERYGVAKKSLYSYDNFDSIKDDPDVDVVYIILPNMMHAEFTVRAAKAGKHVLCEKPMAIDANECQQMIDACKSADKKLMIAYRLRYEPFNQTMIEMARKKAYGKIRIIEAQNIQNVTAPNIRLSIKTGGGPLGDVGIYCLNATRYITGEDPVELSAVVQQPGDDPRFAEVPESVLWTSKFPSGIVAMCACGFGAAESRRYRVVCEKGWFELERAFGYNGQRILVSDSKGTTELRISGVNHFAREMDHMADCVINNKQPLTPGEEGLADVKALTAINESIKTGTTVKI